MKVLILVMSARRDPWDKLMDTQMETWDSGLHPQTHTLYYCGKSTNATTSRIFYSPTLGEELEEISPRTIEAFEKSLEYDWEYMARVHASTYVHKDNLAKFCHTLRRHKVLCGIIAGGDRPFIWGGCHYVFSRDVVDSFVRNKDKWNTKVMEDNSITEMKDHLGLPVTEGHSATINLQPDGNHLCLVYGHGDSFNFRSYEEFAEKAQGHFFVRCKQDLERHKDIEIMRELKRCWQ